MRFKLYLTQKFDQFDQLWFFPKCIFQRNKKQKENK